MKKTLLTTLFLTAAAAAAAAPFNTNTGTFIGTAVEIGAGATKSDFKNSSLNEKYKADMTIRSSHNVQFGNTNWIGGAEVAVKPLHRTVSSSAAGDVKQKVDAGVSYIQGYRLTDDVMAYGKVGYHYGKFEGPYNTNKNMNGIGYGVGVKYAAAPNVEVGAEWEQTRFKKNDVKINNNGIMATVAYRFR
ncbi:outer membrane protein [Neisseria iguanae]|uniref:Porin family protein n=1 Tax=Neisseria iguanae TaxID=90242 RepID=A0A2P7TX86_9NEIS|nr:outer membrane beta-barrel protein [Neisseria iguanae]PSJ79340.1 porin family protein [Neisseria iguanae]